MFQAAGISEPHKLQTHKTAMGLELNFDPARSRSFIGYKLLLVSFDPKKLSFNPPLLITPEINCLYNF
jgi:hypothetical protein